MIAVAKGLPPAHARALAAIEAHRKAVADLDNAIREAAAALERVRVGGAELERLVNRLSTTAGLAPELMYDPARNAEMLLQRRGFSPTVGAALEPALVRLERVVREAAGLVEEV